MGVADILGTDWIKIFEMRIAILSHYGVEVMA
jgi:hypothetical protein